MSLGDGGIPTYEFALQTRLLRAMSSVIAAPHLQDDSEIVTQDTEAPCDNAKERDEIFKRI